MTDIITGFKYAFSGFGLLTKPGIRLFVLVPLLINIALFTTAIFFGANMLSDFINSTLTGWWEWLQWLLWPVFIIIALTVVFFCFSIIANLIAAPFNGFLAEHVEIQLIGSAVENNSTGPGRIFQEIKNALVSELRKFIYFVIRALPLIILFFIPMVNLAAPFLWFIFGAWMLALEYMDFPMGNHGILFDELRNRLKARRSLVYGFGLGIMLLTLIPVINFLALPAAVCGATRLWVEKLQPAQTP
ncbi:MAG: sulfate transporter CysZ [Gammaproteobacteria bacterium]|nr:sulfate transporter CysZ [Gammaproteobacteria bacterium]NIN62050.1 sulfate transporter CysZ [Gammaproteobacteria bacterium]NIO62129.1 sulfate transporter CysZ [Gammaproteobacteria bacterium]NIQ08261.1 sulfate transporter CysZ [Gammaproteobacteria bacterium]NIQ19841.1 sulfate transporter CysZ [Gammaproteobacteria bacterium]